MYIDLEGGGEFCELDLHVHMAVARVLSSLDLSLLLLTDHDLMTLDGVKCTAICIFINIPRGG